MRVAVFREFLYRRVTPFRMGYHCEQSETLESRIPIEASSIFRLLIAF